MAEYPVEVIWDPRTRDFASARLRTGRRLRGAVRYRKHTLDKDSPLTARLLARVNGAEGSALLRGRDTTIVWEGDRIDTYEGHGTKGAWTRC